MPARRPSENSFRGIVLLGCRLGSGGRPNGASLRRARRVLDLAAACRPSLIVVSGGRRWFGVAEADGLAGYLVDHGVPPGCLSIERLSLSTCENAAYSERRLRGLAPEEVAIVTCDWHLPRALRAFSAVGVHAHGIGVATPPRPRIRRVLRAARERAAWHMDRLATWGLLAPCAR